MFQPFSWEYLAGFPEVDVSKIYWPTKNAWLEFKKNNLGGGFNPSQKY